MAGGEWKELCLHSKWHQTWQVSALPLSLTPRGLSVGSGFEWGWNCSPFRELCLGPPSHSSLSLLPYSQGDKQPTQKFCFCPAQLPPMAASFNTGQAKGGSPGCSAPAAPNALTPSYLQPRSSCWGWRELGKQIASEEGGTNRSFPASCLPDSPVRERRKRHFNTSETFLQMTDNPDCPVSFTV